MQKYILSYKSGGKANIRIIGKKNRGVIKNKKKANQGHKSCEKQMIVVENYNNIDVVIVRAVAQLVYMRYLMRLMGARTVYDSKQ